MPTLETTVRRRLSVGVVVGCLLLALVPGSTVGRAGPSPAARTHSATADLTPIVLFPGLALHPADRSPSSTSARIRVARRPGRSRTSPSRTRGRPSRRSAATS